MKLIYNKWVLSALISVHVLTIYSSSISQDDYSTLADIARGGILAPFQSIWNEMGGNVSSIVPRTIALTINAEPPKNFGLILFSLATFTLIYKTIKIILSCVIASLIQISKVNQAILILILMLGFEGIFTPGLAGIASFSAAAAVHVWPICFLVISLGWLNQGKVKFSFALVFLLYASNSNAPEGFLTLIAITVLIIFRKKLDSLRNFRTRLIISELIVSVGFVLIFLAPGFSQRSAQVGLHVDPINLVLRILTNSGIFLFDILTHPIIYIAFLLGNFVSKSSNIEINSKMAIILPVVIAIYFSLLVGGASIAYVSWHQSLGLYVLIPPAAFLIGANFEKKFNFTSNLLKITVICLSILALMLVTRAEFMMLNRKVQFNSNFQGNVCEVLLIPRGTLTGAEILYPPFNLGIEDVNRWEWMGESFKNWVVHTPKLRQTCS